MQSTGHTSTHFDKPQCVEVCPVDCIPLDPGVVETREQLQVKYEGLLAAGIARRG